MPRSARSWRLAKPPDWFWWFGDYNPAAAVRDFDELFRHQLAACTVHCTWNPGDAGTQHQPATAPESGGVMRRSSPE
jgi:hypothetical protein